MFQIKKWILSLLLIAISFYFAGCDKSKTNWTVDYGYKSNNPLGLKLFYNSLNYHFPKADLHYYKSHVSFSEIVSKRNYKYERPLYVVIANSFNPNDDEWYDMKEALLKGYDIWISADNFNDLVLNDIILSSKALNMPKNDSIGDNYEIQMANICLNILHENDKSKSYKGILPNNAYQYFEFDKLIDTIEPIQSVRKINVFEKDCGSGKATYLIIQTGYGTLYLHHNPMYLTNSFLLQNQNFQYLSDLFQTLDNEIDLVEFQSYIHAEKSDSSISQLLKYWPLKIAFWLFIAIAIIYVLTEIKRKQRIIPVINKDESNTVSFIKTVGQLYFNLGNNKNIAIKMGQFYLEQVRTKYGINTQQLDGQFIEKMHVKSGKSLADIEEFVNMYHAILLSNKVDNQTLSIYQSIIQKISV